MTHVKTHPDAAPVEIPAGSEISRDPIEGGICVVNAAVPAGEDGHTVWRTLVVEDHAQRDRDAAASVAFRRANALLFLRLRRNAMLRTTDNLISPPGDVPPLTSAKRSAWAAWREKLRDLPATVADPETPQWPEPPEPLSMLLEWRTLWPGLTWIGE